MESDAIQKSILNDKKRNWNTEEDCNKYEEKSWYHYSDGDFEHCQKEVKRKLEALDAEKRQKHINERKQIWDDENWDRNDCNKEIATFMRNICESHVSGKLTANYKEQIKGLWTSPEACRKYKHRKENWRMKLGLSSSHLASASSDMQLCCDYVFGHTWNNRANE